MIIKETMLVPKRKIFLDIFDIYPVFYVRINICSKKTEWK